MSAWRTGARATHCSAAASQHLCDVLPIEGDAESHYVPMLSNMLHMMYVQCQQLPP